jgi:hypothetical protein
MSQCYNLQYNKGVARWEWEKLWEAGNRYIEISITPSHFAVSKTSLTNEVYLKTVSKTLIYLLIEIAYLITWYPIDNKSQSGGLSTDLGISIIFNFLLWIFSDIMKEQKVAIFLHPLFRLTIVIIFIMFALSFLPKYLK